MQTYRVIVTIDLFTMTAADFLSSAGMLRHKEKMGTKEPDENGNGTCTWKIVENPELRRVCRNKF